MSNQQPLTVTWFECPFRVRSYELDSFGHVNHAVYLNYFEQARFEALTAGGFSIARLAEKGWAIHVVRAEVNYRREARLGQAIQVLTRVEQVRTTSMTLEQIAIDPMRSRASAAEMLPPADAVFAEGKVVIVWIGPNRKPMRIPAEVRTALGVSV